ncbi:MAG: hypothetical protein QXU18_02075 [Thermoplasmatales archaeon]
MRILEEIRKKGYVGGYSTLKDYCRTLRKDRAKTAVIKFETEAGRQARVDFGDFDRIDIDGGISKYLVHEIISASREDERNQNIEFRGSF